MKSLEPSANLKSFRNMESPVPYHSDSSYGDDTPSPVSTNSIAGPSRSILADYQNVVNSYDEDNIPTINDVESLKKGIIKTSKNRANRPYTILLVGETGVGKSSVLEFIANVLSGNDIDHYNFNILDHTNERGGSNNLSQTNSTRLYELMSNNGVAVRILDTPGLADTGDRRQDERHMKSIAAQVEKHADSITAVIILANGTVPRITVGTDDSLSLLSTIPLKIPTKNISCILTNLSSALYQNFPGNTGILKDAPQFHLNNPIALQRKYLKLKDDTTMKKGSIDLRKMVKADEQKSLEMLVDLFEWLGGLDRPTTQNVVINIADGLAQQMKELLRKVMEEGIWKVRRILIG